MGMGKDDYNGRRKTRFQERNPARSMRCYLPWGKPRARSHVHPQILGMFGNDLEVLCPSKRKHQVLCSGKHSLSLAFERSSGT